MRIRITAALATAALLATPAAADAAKDRTPPCRYEDGSGQARCVWDARHMGNGEGRSLLIRRGGTDRAEYIRITHRRAHRLMTTAR